MDAPVFDAHVPPKDPRSIAISERMEILGRVPLFDGVAKRHLRHLAKLSHVEQFEVGQSMLIEGRPSTRAYVIVAGSATVRRNGRKIADLGANDLVGELGLLCERPRMATVRTTTPVEAIVLDRKGLKAAVEEFPRLGWVLLETVAERLSGP